MNCGRHPHQLERRISRAGENHKRGMLGSDDMPLKWDEEDRSNGPPRHQPQPKQLPLSPKGTNSYTPSNLQDHLGKIR